MIAAWAAISNYLNYTGQNGKIQFVTAGVTEKKQICAQNQSIKRGENEKLVRQNKKADKNIEKPIANLKKV